MSGQGEAQENTAAVGQVRAEQRTLDAMYAQLDAEIGVAEEALAAAIAQPVDGAGDRRVRDLEVARLSDRIARFRQAEHGLCFGRLDGAGASQPLYIGRIGLRTATGEALLVDWRAEAAGGFYAATSATPMGVRRRRHLRLRGRQVLGVTDEILDGSAPTGADVVGDGPLAEALSVARTGRMQEAAATLQAEQDAIVRSADRGIVVVDGGPGTGKTIVALHRAAYVLYAFEAAAQGGVLIFGPNQRFLDYISEVLPSLGENDVRLATMTQIVGVEPTRTEPDALARIKGSSVVGEALGRWVQGHRRVGVEVEVVVTGERVRLGPAVVDAARHRALQGGVGHNRARDLFREYLADDLVIELERLTSQEDAEFEAEVEATLGIDLDQETGYGHGAGLSQGWGSTGRASAPTCSIIRRWTVP
ncbi:AAA family ATPase [Nocardioides sp.]|uniref:AAA family ATPase n=1 Tax=Nocardioides sp. TaxID=35761 RepID=UPI002629118A|nr:AAA family ATPase [Nocardioides sp.]